jgi:c-di-GMP-binding flagellar brake protein YcgR
VEFVICEEHRAQVRFSTTSSAADQHVVRGFSTDISPGGMGLRVHQFIPRMCEGTLRVFDPTLRNSDAPGAAATISARHPDGASPGRLLFEHRVKIRRVVMRGEESSYDVGVEFVAPDNALLHRIGELALIASMPMESESPRPTSDTLRRGSAHA